MRKDFRTRTDNFPYMYGNLSARVGNLINGISQ